MFTAHSRSQDWSKICEKLLTVNNKRPNNSTEKSKSQEEKSHRETLTDGKQAPAEMPHVM